MNRIAPNRITQTCLAAVATRAAVAMIASAALFATASTAMAQAAPVLSASSAPWVMRGQSVELTLTGDNLALARKLIIDGPPGVTAQLAEQPATAKSLKVNVVIDAGAPLGERELRVVTPEGVSNKVDLNVTFLPLVAEKEPNNIVPSTGQLGAAQPVTLPATILGIINGATDIDAFRFEAKKGERLIFEVFAQRAGSALDSSLVLLDPTGREVARSEDAIGTDSLIAHEVAVDGQYTLVIHDVQYRGGGNYGYRIHAGAIPYAQAVFPMGGQRGTIVEAQLTGWNLPSDTLRIDLTKQAAGRMNIFATPDGVANPLAFEVNEGHVEFIETEPNNNPAAANFSEPPLVGADNGVVFNGVIQQAGDADFFRFRVAKAAKLRIAVDAVRLGSSLDGLLSLHNANGGVIARAGSSNNQEPAIERDLAPGDYIVGITDLTSLGGSDFGYRVSIAPPVPAAPSFSIRFFPDTIQLPRGGRALVQCEVTRANGFAGPVTVGLKNAPAGVTAMPVTLENGPVSGLFVIEAAADADMSFARLQVVGTGQHGEMKIERAGQPVVRVEPVKAAYLAVREAAPFAIDQARPLTDEEVARVVDEIAALEAKLLAPHAEVDGAAAAWEAKVAATIKGDVSLSDWQTIGPFPAASQDDGFNKAYEPEKEIDLNKVYGTLKWEAKPQWTDGTVWNEFVAESAANYLYRTIEVAADRALELSLGSDDAIKVWHNGKEVLANNIGRGAAPDQEKVTLQLKAGRNTLLMKIINGGGPSGFYFKANAQTHGVPAAIVAALNIAPDQRTADHKALLHTHYRAQAPQLQPIRDQIAVLRKRIGVREEIAQLRRKLVTPTPQLAEGQAKWEQQASGQAWAALEFGQMKAVSGASFIKQPEGSILLTGTSPAKDSYTLTAHSDVKQITAIRLEALPHKDLPAGGPGRALNGNFVLTQFNITAAPASNPTQQTKVELHSPIATFEQAGWPIVNTIDGNDGTGWAVSPRFNEAHTAMFLVKNFTGHEGGTIFTITMHNQSPHDQHNIGHFRISTTALPKPDLKQPTLPASIVSIIRIPASDRTEAQKTQLTSHYLAIAPELAADRQRLASLEALGQAGSPTMKYNQTATVAFEIERAQGFTGDITITALGFAAGRDPQGNPNVITKDLEVTPTILKGDQTLGTLTLKAKDKSQVGTRTIVLLAESMVDGKKVTQISRTIPVTVTP